MVTEEKPPIQFLREGNIDAWNEWRCVAKGSLVRVDLSGLDLSGVDFSGVDFSHVKLVRTNISNSRLVGADLSNADLSNADLSNANLGGAVLIGAELTETTLTNSKLLDADLRGAGSTRANLRRANLSGANLSGAILTEADLSEAELFETVFSNAYLRGADLTKAKLRQTNFAATDLSNVVGLETCRHDGPSMVGLGTLQLSGPLAEAFMVGCGVPKWWLPWLSELASPAAIEWYSSFISYSSKNSTVADEIYKFVKIEHGVPCWQDKHELSPGDELYGGVRNGVHITDKVLLLCSKESLSPGTGWWVDREITIALEKEKKRERDGKKGKVLVAIDIDGFLFTDDCTNKHVDDLRTRVAVKLCEGDRAHQLQRILLALKPGGVGSVFPPLKY
jgi:uncharacterized protein YjbI with pentapeptide repeats